MPHRLYPPAKRAIKEIWNYTADQWGEGQADAYIHGLYNAIQKLANNQMIWRVVSYPGVNSVYFTRYKHHYLFFRELSEGRLGVISVLHERMNLPMRLQDDLDETDR